MPDIQHETFKNEPEVENGNRSSQKEPSNDASTAILKKKRGFLPRLLAGSLLLLVSILLTNTVFLRRQPLPSAPSVSSHATATAIPSPVWSGHNVELAVVDGVAYAASADGAVYALRLSDGIPLWHIPIEGSATEAPQVVSGVVYVSSTQPNYIYALRASNGSLLWRTASISKGYMYTPTVTNGVAYINSQDGTVSALRADSGSLLWRYTTQGHIGQLLQVVNGIIYVNSEVDHGPASFYALQASNGKLLWRYTSEGLVNSFAVVDGVAYVNTQKSGSSESSLLALRTSDGTQLWRHALVGAAFSPPTVLNGILSLLAIQSITQETSPTPETIPSLSGMLLGAVGQLMPSQEKVPLKETFSSVYTLRASDGTVLWHYPLNNGQSSWGAWLSTADEVTYVGVNADRGESSIYALRSKDGSVLWHYETADTPNNAVVSNGTVYVSSNNQVVYALRGRDGTLLWHYPISGNLVNTPILLDGSLYGDYSGVGVEKVREI